MGHKRGEGKGGHNRAGRRRVEEEEEGEEEKEMEEGSHFPLLKHAVQAVCRPRPLP